MSTLVIEYYSSLFRRAYGVLSYSSGAVRLIVVCFEVFSLDDVLPCSAQNTLKSFKVLARLLAPDTQLKVDGFRNVPKMSRS